jgi:SAM-dependent methyltransferase
MPRPSADFYEDAEVFDVLHAPGTRREVDGLERIARTFCAGAAGRRLTWLEPACGTGRYLVEAARRGHRAIGFDLSTSMIRYARGQLKGIGAAPGSRVFVGDMTRFASRVPVADFAFCPINTIRHLGSDSAMRRHLREVRRALSPGGVYAVGLSTSAYGMEVPAEDVWEGRRGDVRVKQIVEYLPPRKSSDRFEQVYSHLVITRGGRNGSEEHRDHAYRLRCYSDRQWRTMVASAGLRIAAVTDDRGEPHDPGPFGYAFYILTRSAPIGSRGTGSSHPARRRRRAAP